MDEGKQITGDDFIDDCAVESDLEMYFPDNYVPGSSERMLLYRELDNIEKTKTLMLIVSVCKTVSVLFHVKVRN